ncbi:MAG: coproporphyrinogen III oxidase, partial [Bacteroidota bacterium]|nr:coproporphyrinogen III oxidase [Bacteroidota bacterium]
DESDLPSAVEKKAQYEMGKRMLTEFGYKDVGMDHFALPTDNLYLALLNGTLHRNFMGYTASKTQLMIGLGVSSISDSWYGFAQNVKNVEEYEDLVTHGVIPIFKGHILSSEDEVLRKHILNIMCQFKTTWTEEEEQVADFQKIQENLSELQSDGLVEIEENSITVTEKGRPFVRNISMAFDLKLHRKKPDTRIFSMTV